MYCGFGERKLKKRGRLAMNVSSGLIFLIKKREKEIMAENFTGIFEYPR